MIKFRWYYDKDKEEIFLNEMTEKGFAMTKFFLGFYKFERCKPNEYTYRVDLINEKTERELRDYINLIEETGAEFVQRWGIWAFFRKKGEFNLYTDIDSQITLYTKIRNTFLWLSIIEIFILPSQINGWFNGSDMSKFFMGTTIFFILIIIIFLSQVYKSNQKIKELKEFKNYE